MSSSNENPSAAVVDAANDIDVPAGMDRRDFLRVSGTMAAATALTTAACAPPPENSVPFTVRPEGMRTGRPREYATIIGGAPVLVKCREGRPILITPNPKAPSGGRMTVRHHAAILDLYDPDREQGPRSVRRGSGPVAEASWATIGGEVVRRLKAKKGDVALLTGPTNGPAMGAAIEEWKQTFGVRHVTYAPIAASAAEAAWAAAYGARPMPRPRLDKAALVVGFGAEFLDNPEDGLDRDFAVRRDPGAAGGMSRFIQLEGRLSLTGANADRRIRVRDSQLANVAAAVAHALIVERRVGPMAGDSAVAASLGRFSARRLGQEQLGVPSEVVGSLASELAAQRGRAVVLAGGTASTAANGPALEAAVLLINEALGAFDAPVFDAEAAVAPPRLDLNGLSRLAADLKSGRVKTLLVAGVNPVYDAPAKIGFAEAMAKADLVVSLNDRIDETSAKADYLAPTSHELESWADVALAGGAVAVQQPVIRPLYATYSLLDLLVAWGAAAGARGALADASALTQPKEGGAKLPENSSGAFHYIRSHWLVGLLPGAGAWDDTLRSGYFLPRRPAPVEATVDQEQEAGKGKAVQAAAAAKGNKGEEAATKGNDDRQADNVEAPVVDRTAFLAGLGVPARPAGDLELQLYPHFAMHDGAAANNGWLHEMPDPITRIAWGGAVSIAPRRFDSLGLKNGDLVKLAVDGTELVAPAYRHAGMHDNQVAVPLGLGRERCGVVGAGVGPNAYPLRNVKGALAIGAGLAVTLTKAGGHEELALGQGSDVIDREARQIVPTATLSEYRRDRKAGTEQTEGGPSIWAEHKYDKGQRWEMAIDLSKCTGCAKCTVACQAENNIPVVGRQAIIDGREMSWLRIDRYYDAPAKEGGWGDGVWDGPLEVVEEPTTLFEPMLCQHCENAPCETVCPFNATMHSADGLNQQIYNRCVGTRYCANNCPFKVRRYNWYEYSFERGSSFFKWLFPQIKRHGELNARGRIAMKNNPEVTVRSRGVMEKCSFCIQRIREARAEAARNGTPGKLDDGAVVPACMEACPSEAIVFGDVNDPKSRIAKAVKDPRAMRLLESTGVKPAISYLTKVRNDNA